MGASEAVSVFLQAVVLAVGLQFIGWAKWRARVAEEAWRNRGGPLDREIIVELQREVDATAANVRRAGEGLAGAARQMGREAS